MRHRLATVFVLAAAATAWATASDWSRLHVHVPDDAAMQRLLDSDLNIMQCHPGCGGTDVIAGPGDEFKLRMLGFDFTYVGPMAAPDAWAKSQINRTAANASIQSDEYRNRYFTADEILTFFENLRTTYPVFVTRRQIGTSINSEPIWAYRFGRPLRTGGQPENNIVFINLIHAREWVSGSVGMHIGLRAAQTLSAPQQTPFLPNQALWIVPITNPDGYRFSWTNDRYWRKNRRRNSGGSFGVDLNRNFGTGWGGGGSSGNQSSLIYRGTAAFSEPESVAIRDFAISLGRVGAYIDFHSFSQLILWPWSYTSNRAADWQAFDAQGRRMQTAIRQPWGVTYTQGQGFQTIYQASGVTPDWFYDRFRASAYTIELRDDGTFGFELPADQIRPTQDEAWAGALQLIAETPR